MKILLSAYACEPHRGSEPGVGWNMAEAIARQHQVYVLTSATHRPGIESELAQHPNPNLHVIYLDPLGWVYDWGRQRRFQIALLHYYLWQIQAYGVARSLHQQENFDLAHHVTYVRYSNPSFLSLLPIPFLWGPVGGAEVCPPTFLADFTWKNQLYERLRSLTHRLGELDPMVHMTARYSAIAWATTTDTALRLQQLGAPRVQVMSEVCMPTDAIHALQQYSSQPSEPRRFISLGRLLHWKGFHLGLKAFAMANLSEAEYWIVGDGPERAALQNLAAELQIEHQVKFWGRLPRHEAMQKLAQSAILIHPSLHDSGGWACLEGMAMAKPVICLNLGGPGISVPNNAGVKVPAESPHQVIQDLATAMQQLGSDPGLQHQMGSVGQAYVAEHYSAEQREVLLNRLYHQLTQADPQASNWVKVAAGGKS
jgi:glycosyltransferase involved in cell wall biosynthesis